MNQRQSEREAVLEAEHDKQILEDQGIFCCYLMI